MKSKDYNLSPTLRRTIMIGLILVMLGVGGLVSPLVSAKRRKSQRPASSNPTMAQATNQQMSYMPASLAIPGNLIVNPQQFAIVAQDGSGGQVNNPVNLYGAHWQVQNDFTIQAAVTPPNQGEAELNLYSSAPITYDEFRLEPARLQLLFASGKLLVSRWDGADGQDIGNKPPAEIKSLPYQHGKQVTVTINRTENKLRVSLGGSKVVSLRERNMFNSGEIWFGASARTASFSLASIGVRPEGRGKVKLIDSTAWRAKQSANGLQQLTVNKRDNFLVGAAVSLAPSVADSGFAELAYGGNFGQITTENALKWQFIHPARNSYDFKEPDALLEIAKNHQLAVHGHTLVFGEANPAWVNQLPTKTPADRAAVQQVMLDHIKVVVGRYKGQIDSWDVVNEPIADYENFNARRGIVLRNHKWHQAMGESYISEAFRAARLADPEAQLYINEYGLEEDGERWQNFLKLVTRLKQSGVPIDGVGFQAHVYEQADKIDAKVLQKHIQQLAALGLKARVSEMDVYNDDGTTVQAEQYASVFAMCLAEPNCVSWTTWGVTDRYDKFLDEGVIESGNDYLWDERLKATPALNRLQDILKQ